MLGNRNHRVVPLRKPLIPAGAASGILAERRASPAVRHSLPIAEQQQ